jgi:hypothetical protein
VLLIIRGRRKREGTGHRERRLAAADVEVAALDARSLLAKAPAIGTPSPQNMPGRCRNGTKPGPPKPSESSSPGATSSPSEELGRLIGWRVQSKMLVLKSEIRFCIWEVVPLSRRV